MAMFTRTVKDCKATAYKMEAVEGESKPQAVPFAEVRFDGANGNENEARKAFKEYNINVPRGSFINVEVLNETVYGCTIQEFMAIARPIER